MAEPDEVNKEPSEFSSNAQERILARRNRIQRRLDTLDHKHSSTSTVVSQVTISNPIKQETTIKKSFSQKQVETSMQILDRLIRDGLELTSNVARAVDAREIERRTAERETKAERTALLELEIKIGQERFLEVEKAWETLFKNKIPKRLYRGLKEQRLACSNLVDEKNKLIEHLKNELEEKDSAFIENIRRVVEDIKIIIDRMNEHIRIMKGAYMGELEAMELAFMQERHSILQKHQKKWDLTLKKMNGQEDEYVETRKQLIDICQEELDKQWKEDSKEYNHLKTRMESDIMLLELESRSLKTKVLLNYEKLEYNYYTLKKREEENSVMKNRQKRKLTKMNDTMANLKKKLRDLEKQCSDETQKLSVEYKRIVSRLLDLEKKFTLFQKVDIGKYRDVWKLNESDMKETVKRLAELDEIIHKQFLDIPWTDINFAFLENNGPWGRYALNPITSPETLPDGEDTADTDPSLLSDDEKKLLKEQAARQKDIMSTDVQTDQKIRSSDTAQSRTTAFQYPRTSKPLQLYDTLAHQVLQRIALLLCDHTGFLVEDRVVKLINTLPKNEKKLVKVTTIFNALSIYSEDEMRLLGEYFARYAVKDEFLPSSGGSLDNLSLPSREKFRTTILKVPKKPNSITIYPEHLNPGDVLRAIREFVTDHRKVRTVVAKVPTLYCQRLLRNKETDAQYWHLYWQAFPKSHIRLWKALIPALEKYHNILRQRENLKTEVNCLRVQNKELHVILNQYLKAKINHELKLPPIPVQILTENVPPPTNSIKKHDSCGFLPPLKPNKVQIPLNEKTFCNQYLNL